MENICGNCNLGLERKDCSRYEYEQCKSESVVNKYPNIDKAYMLDNNVMIGVDQSSVGEDKTCLCFCRLVKGKFHTERFEFIEKQEDMDKYINENTARWIGIVI